MRRKTPEETSHMRACFSFLLRISISRSRVIAQPLSWHTAVSNLPPTYYLPRKLQPTSLQPKRIKQRRRGHRYHIGSHASKSSFPIRHLPMVLIGGTKIPQITLPRILERLYPSADHSSRYNPTYYWVAWRVREGIRVLWDGRAGWEEWFFNLLLAKTGRGCGAVPRREDGA